ncbi:hypothetical protein GCM10007094_23400 [Pseudovibrio japonicus]|uniref:Uncharacterized protein n=1 Tax=Pseudovibrio japonicus TaxID=366534 RepID=A0ABQ3EGB9_9HYPH|nr:hypothetical protein [Pseudovibrio japonicus]GHB33831.1 hypothetical protein GCM10007094_23400 [Pseudovibrio japonicus]
MVANGAVVQEGLSDLERSKIKMLLVLQNNSHKLSAVMRKELFRLIGSKRKVETAAIRSNQEACQTAYKLVVQYREELEHVRAVKRTFEQFSRTAAQSDTCRVSDRTPKCLSYYLLDGPASDQGLTLNP